MTATRALSLLATLVAAIAVVESGAADSTEAQLASVPPPLHGLSLTGRTGLQLLVADDPPLLITVDTGAITPIRGLTTDDQPVLAVSAVGDTTVVWLDHRTGEAVPRGELYLIHHGSTRAKRIASGWQVAADRSGRALWLIRYRSAHRCVLSELALDGRMLSSPRPVPCSAQLVDSGGGPVLVDGDTARDPASGKLVLEGSRLWAISGDYALSSNDSHAPLTLTNLRRGSRRELAWPSRIGGTDQAVVDPRTGLIALDFADPAYGGTGTQVTDAWLLNPKTGRFTHLPDMPAAVHLKFTSMAWTRDGRLITLAGTSSGTAGQTLVAVWKPGQKQLRIRRLTLPARTSGSDSFTIAEP